MTTNIEMQMNMHPMLVAYSLVSSILPASIRNLNVRQERVHLVLNGRYRSTKKSRNVEDNWVLLPVQSDIDTQSFISLV